MTDNIPAVLQRDQEGFLVNPDWSETNAQLIAQGEDITLTLTIGRSCSYSESFTAKPKPPQPCAHW